MKFSFFFSLFLLFQSWYLLLIPSLFLDEHPFTITNLTLYINLIFLLSLFMIFVIYRIQIKKSLQFFLSNFLIFIIFLGIVLSNFDFFLNSNVFKKILILSFCFVLISGIQFIILRKKKSIYFLFFFTIFQILSLSYNFLYIKDNNKDYYSKYNLNIEFKNKPNIFLFSFDGLAPNKILKDSYGIDLKLNASKENLIILSNTFNENVYTKPALNTLFLLDPEIWRDKENHNGPTGNKSYFSGVSSSPLYSILKNNGYKVGTGYVPGAWSLQGKYSDEYNLNKHGEKIFPMFCRWPLPYYYFNLFSFCKIYDLFVQKTNNDYKNFIYKEIKNIRDIEDKNFYLSAIESIKSKANSNEPWFYAQHIYRPGHTNSDYIHGDKNFLKFSKFYAKRTLEALDMINQIIENILESNSNSILIIFGDHGPLLSRDYDVNLNQNKQKIEFEIIDKHAAFLAYYDPSSICIDDVKKLENDKDYKTPSMLLNQILTCLSGDISPLKKEPKYLLPYDGLKFEDFLYE